MPETCCIGFPLIFLNNYLQRASSLQAEILSVQKTSQLNPPGTCLSWFFIYWGKKTRNLRKNLGVHFEFQADIP